MPEPNTSKLRLMLVLEEPFEQDAQGRYHSDFSWLVFGGALLRQFGESIVVCPMRTVESSSAKNTFEADGFRFMGLPWYTSFASFYKHLPSSRSRHHRIIEEAVTQSDVVLVRAPSQVGNIALKYAKKHGKPLVTLYAGCTLRSDASNLRHTQWS